MFGPSIQLEFGLSHTSWGGVYLIGTLGSALVLTYSGSLIDYYKLNYYTFFLQFDQVSSAIGILTTTFLSGIALYFSTEKPQPLRITTIDLIFILTNYSGDIAS